MAVFRYEALNAQGKTVKGSMEADSPRAAHNQMRMQGMTPIEVLEVGSAKMTGKIYRCPRAAVQRTTKR